MHLLTVGNVPCQKKRTHFVLLCLFNVFMHHNNIMSLNLPGAFLSKY